MCSLLEVSRSLVYYHLSKSVSTSCDEELIVTNHIKEIFRRSINNYGPRKIKVELDSWTIRFQEEGYLEL